MKHRPTALLIAVLVLALAAFTGSAFAGDGHGNGGGDNGKAANASGHDQSSGTTGDNSTGVKPSNKTSHDTHAAASSDKTKQYGNGKTAGQIATKAGHGNDTLHGPGNSQPHKTSACPGGHEVDVHALKNKGSSKCASSEHKSSEHAQQKVESKQVEVKKTEEQKTEEQKTEEQKQTEMNGVSASAHEHVTICHATGSASNPFVRISPSASGVFHGHLGHQDGRDIVPPFTWNGQTFSENWDANGQAIWNAGCTAPAAAAAAAQAQVQGAQATPCTTTQTVTEQVAVGVKHFIGPKGSGRYVVIHPNAHSAHYKLKHPDEVIYQTVTKTITVPATNCATPQTPAAVAPAAPAAPQVAATAAATATPAAATPTATPAAAGAVKGAVVTLKPTKTKPSGGVLGATTRLGHTVAGSRLPFTGLPLWIFVIVAAGLIAIGATVRRTASRRTY